MIEAHADVVVVGSINQDLTVLTPTHPKPGETVMGSGHFTGQGGKGANQAVAAARLGASVAFLGCLGDDDAGREALEQLGSEGIDVSPIVVHPERLTGLAVISVDDSGENSIVVSPGANSELRPSHVAQNTKRFRRAAVTLAQLEVPLDTVVAAAELSGGSFVLNPAPARPLPEKLLELTDILIPNRLELATLIGRPGDELEEMSDIVSAARSISGRCCVVVTLGKRGAVVIEDDDVTLVEAPRVQAVDTTGAGDTFCGALATRLAEGAGVVASAQWACLAAARAVTKHGAQDGMPTRADMAEAVAGAEE